mgnify:CR=1 FL=1
MDESDSYKVADITLADSGERRVDWARARMPVLARLKAEAEENKPLTGMVVAGCLHVTKETAVLIETIEAAGAKVSWSGCNPLSTQDDVAAWLAREGYSIYAWHGQSVEDFYWCIDRTVEANPTLTLDDGADLIVRVHGEMSDYADGVIGGTEETTTGVHRLRAMGEAGDLRYPVIAVNDAITKWDFDNVYGTGQSTLDGIIRATSVLIAGKTFVVAGYGHCGRGLAMRAKGMGANVIVTEIDPICALQAAMEGYEVVLMDEMIGQADIVVTATGNKDIVTADHMRAMKDRSILCNIGHFDNEIQVEALKNYKWDEIKPQVHEITFPDNKRIILLAEGRLVNLGCATGHPSFVMSASFTNQVTAQIELWNNSDKYENKVYVLPKHLDEKVARLHLEKVGAKLTPLSKDQADYISVKPEGPYKPDAYRY